LTPPISPPYIATQPRVDEAWLDRGQWSRDSLLNIARMGKFSTDRSQAYLADQGSRDLSLAHAGLE